MCLYLFPVIRGAPSPVSTWPQVSVPLISRPVTILDGAGPLPPWSPAGMRILLISNSVYHVTCLPVCVKLMKSEQYLYLSQTFATPASDYKWVREKLGKQKRNSRKGLSKLLGKTRPSHPIAGEVDKSGLYTS